jgi:hypothetical protein
MGVRTLAFLAVVVGSGAFEVDFKYLEAVADDLYDHFSSNLRALVHEHSRTAPGATDNATCSKCVQTGTKFVVDKTMAKMTEMCKAAQNGPHSCIAKKVCGMMAKHSKVTLGMIMEHVRPLSLSTAYCFGKGACKEPNSVTMDEIAMGEMPHEALLDHFDGMDWSEVEEQTLSLDPASDDAIEVDTSDAAMGECMDEFQKMRKKMPVCPKCMKGTMRRVVGFAVKKVKGMCMMCAQSDADKCKVMQKMCPWAAANKETALGMLIAKVEPWKFALGHCFHQKKFQHQNKFQHAWHKFHEWHHNGGHFPHGPHGFHGWGPAQMKQFFRGSTEGASYMV